MGLMKNMMMVKIITYKEDKYLFFSEFL